MRGRTASHEIPRRAVYRYPERYEETLGSITEHGHLEAVSVDNSEGWDEHIIDSGMYISFAYGREQ